MHAITATRVLAEGDPAPRFDASEAERFGFTRSGGAPTSASSGASGAQAASSPGRPPVDFELPEGWRELAPTSMRILNFAPPGDSGADCYLSSLPGTAGGLLANVNRWRGQMAQPPITQQQAESLPRASLFGMQASVVDVRGAFTGMSGERSEGEQRLLGLLHVSPEGSLFLKAVGPVEVWEHEADAFFALAASMRPAAAPAHDHASHAGQPHPTDEPHDHASHVGQPHPGDDAPGDAVSGAPLAWQVPAAWTLASGSSMSLAAFELRDEPQLRVTLSLLPGSAGGVRANLDRWSEQVGHSALSDADFAALPKVSVLGRDAFLLERAGPFAGMGASAQGDALLLGVVQPLGAQTVFVKLVGPRKIAQTQRAAFLEFCASLKAPRNG
ncbi:MAG: hypothetical protein DHS20C15_30010 [Planctomycetota bacterium]|nr:MAG: hypothetical protein DHS20C15_30010 [Planctomycetota bacterium]